MKSTTNFGVRFILRHAKNNFSESLIYARITVNKKRAEISLNKAVNSDYWDFEKQCASGPKELVTRINPYLDEVRYKLNNCHQQLRMKNAFITVEAIKRLYSGEEEKQNSLLTLIAYHTSSTKGLLKHGTLKNYSSTEKYLLLFLKKKYNSGDILLGELNYQFITQFELFLRTTEPLEKSNPLTNNGVMKHMERLRKMVTMAFKLDWIQKDPFIQYKLKFQRTEREFLVESEIETLEKIKLPNVKLEKCRDMFLFSCYTGLAYVDLANLDSNNISIGIDGEQWLRTSRQKTDTRVSVPLLPQAISILNQYKEHPELIREGRILPYISNQKMNEYLKEIAIECKINKNMTFHLARHTFATTVTLNNGIPIETVSKMLGHTKLSTTQIYVHVLERKISDDMKVLRDKLSQKSKVNRIAV